MVSSFALFFPMRAHQLMPSTHKSVISVYFRKALWVCHMMYFKSPLIASINKTLLFSVFLPPPPLQKKKKREKETLLLLLIYYFSFCENFPRWESRSGLFENNVGKQLLNRREEHRQPAYKHQWNVALEMGQTMIFLGPIWVSRVQSRNKSQLSLQGFFLMYRYLWNALEEGLADS